MCSSEMSRLAEKNLLLLLILAVQAKAGEVRWKTVISTGIDLSVSANISTVPEACRFRHKPQPVTISRCVAYMIQDHPKSAAFKATLLNINFRNITLYSQNTYIKADLYFDTIRLESLYANIITQTSLSSVKRFVENNVNDDRAVRLAFYFTDMVHFDSLGDKVIGASGYVYMNGTAMTYLNEHADPHSAVFNDTFDLIRTSFMANLPQDLVTAIKMIKPLKCTFKWGRWFVFGPSYAFCEAAVHFDKERLSNVDMRFLGFAEGGSLQRVLDVLFHSYTGDGFHQFAITVLRISGYVYHNRSRVHRIDLMKLIHGENGKRLKASIKSSISNAINHTSYRRSPWKVDHISLQSVEGYVYGVARIEINVTKVLNPYKSMGYIRFESRFIYYLNLELKYSKATGFHKVELTCKSETLLAE